MKKLFLTLLVAALCSLGVAQDKVVIDHASHGGADVGYRYGFVDANEKWIIPPKYDNAEWHQNEGFAIVTLYATATAPQLKGVINKYGDFTIPLSAEFNKIRHEKESGNLLVGKKVNGVQLWGITTYDGRQLLPVKYQQIEFEDNRFSAELPSGATAWFDKAGQPTSAPE